jgi:hypothetical protein
MKKTVHFVVCMFVLTMAAHGQSYPINLSELSEQELIFTMSSGGDSLGYSKITITRANNKWSVSEKAHVKSSFELEEEMTTYLNDQLSWDSVFVKGAFNVTKAFQSFSKVSGKRLIAESNYNQLFGKEFTSLDTTLSSPVVERLSSLFLFPTLIDFSKKDHYQYWQFNPTDCEFRMVTVTKASDEIIDTPKGEVETYRLEFSGGVAEQVLFISKTSPRKIVRIEFKDSDWVYTLN